MKSKSPTYTFQCPTCFIISGHMSKNMDDAPSCCGGVRMVPILVGKPNKGKGKTE